MAETHLPPIDREHITPRDGTMQCAGKHFTLWKFAYSSRPPQERPDSYVTGLDWHLHSGKTIGLDDLLGSFASADDAKLWVQRTMYWRTVEIDWAPLTEKILTEAPRLAAALRAGVFGLADLDQLDELAAASIAGPAPQRGSGVPAQTNAWKAMYAQVEAAVKAVPGPEHDKVHIKLIPEAIDVLEQLSRMTGMTREALINRSIQLYGHLEVKTHDGYTVHLKAPNGISERLHWKTDLQAAAQHRGAAGPGGTV
jgi:hypothetical protein